MPPFTFDELRSLPTVVDLMTAARALDIGRTKAYQMAKTGEFPVRIIRVGSGYHVPTAELMKVLGVEPIVETSADRDDGSRQNSTG